MLSPHAPVQLREPDVASGWGVNGARPGSTRRQTAGEFSSDRGVTARGVSLFSRQRSGPRLDNHSRHNAESSTRAGDHPGLARALQSPAGRK